MARVMAGCIINVRLNGGGESESPFGPSRGETAVETELDEDMPSNMVRGHAVDTVLEQELGQAVYPNLWLATFVASAWLAGAIPRSSSRIFAPSGFSTLTRKAFARDTSSSESSECTSTSSLHKPLLFKSSPFSSKISLNAFWKTLVARESTERFSSEGDEYVKDLLPRE
jgi:hypothetical protein